MNEVRVIGVQFGPFPNYFPLFLESCRWNTGIDWLLFTDQDLPGPHPPHINVVRLTFDEFRARTEAALGVTIALPRPYKLVDFRPMFGRVFEEELRGYTFWGHCDFDLVFGNIGRFITADVLERFDKILIRGCFALFRNVPAINSLYAAEGGQDWQEVARHPEVLQFDEWPGIYQKVVARDVSLFNEDVIADIFPYHWDMRPTTDRSAGVRLFFIDRSAEPALWQYSWRKDGGLDKRERMLIHLQKRKMAPPPPGMLSAPVWAFGSHGFQGEQDPAVCSSRAYAARLNAPSFVQEMRILWRRLVRKLKVAGQKFRPSRGS